MGPSIVYNEVIDSFTEVHLALVQSAQVTINVSLVIMFDSSIASEIGLEVSYRQDGKDKGRAWSEDDSAPDPSEI